MRGSRSGCLSTKCTTAGECTRHCNTGLRCSSKRRRFSNFHNRKRLLYRGYRYELSKARGNLSIRCAASWLGWCGATLLLRPAPHRLDEFPAGYSLDGCSPAEPPSASPTGSSVGEKQGAGNDFPPNGNQCHYYLSQA